MKKPCSSAVAAEGDADGPQLPGHAGAYLIIMGEVILFGLALLPLTDLEFPPVGTGFVAAGEVGGTAGLTGQHGGTTPSNDAVQNRKQYSPHRRTYATKRV